MQIFINVNEISIYDLEFLSFISSLLLSGLLFPSFHSWIIGQWNKKARNLSYGWSIIQWLVNLQIINEKVQPLNTWWSRSNRQAQIINETQKKRALDRQADTKDLTSSSKVLRVLGPNLTDAALINLFLSFVFILFYDPLWTSVSSLSVTRICPKVPSSRINDLQPWRSHALLFYFLQLN